MPLEWPLVDKLLCHNELDQILSLSAFSKPGPGKSKISVKTFHRILIAWERPEHDASEKYSVIMHATCMRGHGEWRVHFLID